MLDLNLIEVLRQITFSNLLILKILTILSFIFLTKQVKKVNLEQNEKLIAMSWQWFILLIPIIGEIWLILLGFISGKDYNRLAKYITQKIQVKSVELKFYGGKMVVAGVFSLLYYTRLIYANYFDRFFYQDQGKSILATFITLVVCYAFCSLIVSNIINKRDLNTMLKLCKKS